MKVVETALKTNEIAPFQKNFFGGGGGFAACIPKIPIFLSCPLPREILHTPLYICMYIFIYLNSLLVKKKTETN